MLDSLHGKFIFSFKSLVFTPIVWFIEQYIWSDWNLLITIILLLFLDGSALCLRAILNKSYTIAEAMRNFGVKTLSIALVVFAIGVFDSATVKGNQIQVLELINYGFYTMLLAFLFISLLTNIYKIYPLEFIKKMIDKLNRLFE